MSQGGLKLSGGAAQAAPLPAKPQSIDTRLLCWRFPIGWDKWEVRLEAHRTTDPAELGRIFFSDDEGNRVELDWNVLRELAESLPDAVDTIWNDREALRKAQMAKAGEHG